MAKKLNELVGIKDKSTLVSYVAKAAKSSKDHSYMSGMMDADNIAGLAKHHGKKADKRTDGISKAVTRLAKEDNEIDEGLVYSDNKEPFSGNIHKINPNNAYKNHLENHHYLSFIHKNGSTTEKIQASKELEIADKKMSYWKKHPEFSSTQAEKDHKAAKAKWAIKEEIYFDESEQIDEKDSSLVGTHKIGKSDVKRAWAATSVPANKNSRIQYTNTHAIIHNDDGTQYHVLGGHKHLDDGVESKHSLPIHKQKIMVKKAANTNEETSVDEAKDWDPETRTEREVSHYNIINHRTGAKVGKATTKNGARRSIDKHDNDYGAYAHRSVPVWKEETVVEDTKFAPKKLKDIINKPSKKWNEYKGNTKDEQDIIKKYDDNTVTHADRNGNGDDVFKGSKQHRDEKKVAPGHDEKKYGEWNGDVTNIGEEAEADDKLKTYHYDYGHEGKNIKGYGQLGAKNHEHAKHVLKNIITDHDSSVDHKEVHAKIIRATHDGDSWSEHTVLDKKPGEEL